MSEHLPGENSTTKIGWWLLGGVLLAVAVGGALVGIHLYQFRTALKTIDAAGGTVSFVPSSWVTVEHTEPFPFLDRVNSVDLYGSPLAPGDLEAVLKIVVRQFPDIERLGLSETQVSPASLEMLVELHALRTLFLQHAPISDEEVATVVKLASLRQLDLGRTQITDDAMPLLTNLHDIEDLFLDSTSVSDEGIRALKSLNKLKVLSLSNTNVSDEGLGRLGRHLPDMEVFDD